MKIGLYHRSRTVGNLNSSSSVLRIVSEEPTIPNGKRNIPIPLREQPSMANLLLRNDTVLDLQ